MGGTSGFGSPLGTPSYTATASSSGYYGTGGFSYPVPDPTEKPERIPVLSSRMRKIKVKEEKIEPEWTEVNPSPVFEMALRIAKNSFYGILGIKVKGTKTPEVSGRIKKIKS